MFTTWISRRFNGQRRAPRRHGPGHRPAFRPQLLALEDRVVPATCTWTGGSALSNHWSDFFNWEGLRRPTEPGDNVDMPADAKQRSNVVDIDVAGIKNLHIHGGNYHLSGNTLVVTTGVLVDAGDNTIDNTLDFVLSQSGSIDVEGGSLALTGEVTGDSDVSGDQDLFKSGAGTLKVSNSFGADTFIAPLFDEAFHSFVVAGGLVSLEAGGVLHARLEVQNGTVRLQSGGDQISSLDSGIGFFPVVTVDAGGVVDLFGHSEALGHLTLNGGRVTSTGLGAGHLIIEQPVITTASDQTATIDVNNIELGDDDRTFFIFDGTAADDLVISSRIQGTGGLTKQGLGRLRFSGSLSNTYTGATQVNEGDLFLDKPDGVAAIVGGLTVGDGFGGTNADRVVLRSDDQIANTIRPRINSSGLLNVLNHTETLPGFVLAGGNVTTFSSSLGLLKLTGDVTTVAAPTVAGISGRVDMQNATRVFNVVDSVSGTDLLVDAVLSNGNLFKSGAGTLELTAANTYSGDTVIGQGQLIVNGSLANSLVRFSETGSGILLGTGTVKGITVNGGQVAPGSQVTGNAGIGTLTSTADVTFNSFSTFQPQVVPLTPDPHDLLKVQGKVNLGGAKLTLAPQFLVSAPPPIPIFIDDSSSSFSATSGFGTTTGSSSGFLGNSARIAVAGTGAQQATWTFGNLQPGSYRVSAAWGNGVSNRATNAPYAIVNGTDVTTVRVNQQLSPADFSSFGVNWDILGVVQVTGNSLTVNLTNDANGSVVADAILIEPRQVVIIDNDGADNVLGTFANLPEGATVSAVAVGVVNGQVQQQTQLYTISYRANDGNDVGLAYVTTQTAAQDLLISPASINEGQKVKLTGRLTDPDVGDVLSLRVNWGDGTPVQTFADLGTKPFRFTHTYADNSPPGSPYEVRVEWFDQHGAGNFQKLFVTVNNVPPRVFLGGAEVVHVDEVMHHTGRVTDPGADTWTATVNYGDGSGTQPLTVQPDGTLLFAHLYQRPGRYRVTVSVFDDDGDVSSDTFVVIVPPRH